MTGSEAVSEKPSLYDRLGGVYSIATVVEDLIDRVMVDPRLNANPRVDEAHHKVPPAGFKYLVTEILCWAAGGPQRYSGRSMEKSHRRQVRFAASYLTDALRRITLGGGSWKRPLRSISRA